MNHYTLNLSKFCQNNCIFCDYKYPLVRNQDFFDVNYSMIIDDIKDSIVSLGGGEPTLNKDLAKIVYKLKNNNNYVELISNGQKFSDARYLKILLDSGIDRFCVSLHSGNKEIHNFLTSNNKSFDLTWRGINNLCGFKKKDLDVNIIFVLNKYNLFDLKYLISILEKFCEINLQINLVNTYKRILLPNLKNVKDYLKDINQGNLNINTFGLTHCILPTNWHDFIADRLNDDKNININGKFYSHKKLVCLAKNKGDFCKLCEYRDKCEGVWKSYFKYGKFNSSIINDG